MAERITLTNDNYYSQQANIDYMSVSQLKSFLKCQAAALAEVRGDYTRPSSTALLQGQYVDTAIEGDKAHIAWLAAHSAEVYTRSGTLKSDYLAAEQAVQAAKNDELFNMMVTGENQTIYTGEVEGVMFKGKFDSLLSSKRVNEIIEKYPDMNDVFGFFHDGAIVDLKYMRSVEPQWSANERAKVSFAQAWGYDLQLAIYQELEGHKLPCFLAVVTKETPPGLHLIYIPQAVLDERLAEARLMIPEIQAIKTGEKPPERCENCPYCRATRRLTTAKYIADYEI